LKGCLPEVERAPTADGSTRMRAEEGRKRETANSLEVDDLVCQTGLVLKAERVLSESVGGEDVVSLLFSFSLKENFVVGIPERRDRKDRR